MDPVGVFMTDRLPDIAWKAERQKALHQLRTYLDGKTEVGLTDVRRDLDNAQVLSDGQVVARMLSTLGWGRDGWMHKGYDRTPRYVRRVA